jgi:hypothetical protein
MTSHLDRIAPPAQTPTPTTRGFTASAAVMGALLLVRGLSTAAGAAVSAPAVAQLDARCDAYASSKSLKRYSLTRVGVAAREPGPWRLASAASNAAVSARTDEWQADFADATTASGKIVSASIVRSDSTGDGATGNEYCFVNGKLARTYLEVDDVSEDQQWKHYTYYNADGSARTTRTVYRYLGKGEHAQPPTPNGLFDMPKYATPAALPFYAAYLKAVAGTLPKL